MANVVVDATGTPLIGGSSVSTINYSGITVGAGLSKGGLIIGLATGNAVASSAWAATWDSGGTNQAMYLIGTLQVGSAGAATTLALFGLRNPTPGNKTCALSWTGANFPVVEAISLNGVEQSSDANAFKNFVSNTSQTIAAGGFLSTTVTSAVNDMVIGWGITSAGFGATPINNTQIYNDATSGGADTDACRAAGASTVTVTVQNGGTANLPIGVCGFDVVAAAGGITLVGSAKGTTTATAPAHAVGDILLVCATRNASATAPSLPAGFTNIGTRLSTLYSSRVGYKIATSTSDANGTWTNATECVIQIYRPSAGNFILVGASASGTGSVTPVTYPALTLLGGTTSWVAAFGGVKGTGTNIGAGVAGLTVDQDEVGTGELVGLDTNGAVSSWAAHNQTVTGTITQWNAWSIELEDYHGVVIDAVSGAFNFGGLTASPVSGSTFSIGPQATSLVIQLSFSDPTTLSTPSSAPTWNGVSLTLIGSKIGSDNLESIYEYGLVNPATGTQTFSVAFSPTLGASSGLQITAWSFKGTDTSSFANCFPSASVLTDASTPAGSVYPAAAFSIATAVGDAICAGYANGSGSNTATNYPTDTGILIYNDSGLNFNGAAWRQATSTTTTLQFTGGSTPGVTAGVAFRIQQPQVGGGVSLGRISHALFRPHQGPSKGLRPTQAFPPPATANISITVPQGNVADSPTAPVVAWTNNYNIVPPQGNVADSPTAPTAALSVNWSITPPQGNVALSPTAEIVSTGINITVPQGNLALSPTAETVLATANWAIVPPQGNIALSPTAEKLDLGIKPPQGNIALSPTAETVAATANWAIVPPQGNLVLSPTAETVARTANFSFTVPQGNVALSPTAETVAWTNNYSLVPTQGNVALSETPPQVGAGGSISIIPGQGNLADSPTAPTVALTANQAITPPQGNEALSGTSPRLDLGSRPSQGNLAVSPTAPTAALTANWAITPPQGNAALSGTSPGVVQNLRPASGQGNAALSPTAPVVALTANWAIVPPQGNVALSAQPPQAGGAMSRVPAQGNVALSGTAPVVARTDNHPITVPQGNVADSPTAPSSVVDFRIAAAQGNIVLSSAPPQTTPGIHPVSGNLGISSAAPVVALGRTHHWRRVAALLGSVYSPHSEHGSVEQKPGLVGTVKLKGTIAGAVKSKSSLSGSVKNDPDIGAS